MTIDQNDKAVPPLPHPVPEQGPAQQPGQESGPSGRALLIAAILVVAGGYFLAVKVRDMNRIQDCALSGRTNCAAIVR